MGLWNKSLEEILERYNAKLEGNYPRHVASAFFAVSYDDSPPASEIGPPYPWPRDEEEIVTEAIESFAQRWGGLSDEIFLRALHETQGRDHLVALFALGYNTAFPAEEVLSPFLESEDLLERCAVAIVLGLRHDERAIPVLEEYLLADVPLIEVPSHLSSKRRWRVQPEAEIWFSSYRQRIVGLVATWGPDSMNVVLQKAFLKYWGKEQNSYYPLYSLPDGIIYALGRRGVLNALLEISLPDFHQRITTIYFALGILHADDRFNDMRGEMLRNNELKQEVISTCVASLGFSIQQAQHYVKMYPFDAVKRDTRKTH